MSNVPLPKVDYDAGWHRQYTADQMHAHAAAVSAAKDARIKVLEDQLRLALTIIGHPDDDITKAMRAALGDKT